MRERAGLRLQDTGSAGTPSDVGLRWSLLAIGLLGLGLRLFRLGSQCLWFDEAQTLSVASLPWAEIARTAYRPPLYHYILHLWQALVPDSELWLRLPSALFGAAVPPLVGLVCRRLNDRRAAVLAAALAAVSPALVAYSQELRMYSLLALEAALLCLLAPRLLAGQSARTRVWIAYGVTAAAALYTHYFALPFVLSLGALCLIMLAVQHRWTLLRRWIGVHALAGLAFVPWLCVILSGRGGTQDFVEAEVSPVLGEVPGVRAFLNRVWLFYSTGPTTSDYAVVHTWALVAGILSLATLGGLLAYRAIRLLRSPRTEPADAALWKDVVPLGLIVLPLGVAAIMYALHPGTVHPRHLMMIGVPLCVVAARAAVLLWDGAQGATVGAARLLCRSAAILWPLCLAGLFVVTLTLYYVDPALQRADVRVLAQRLSDITSADDVILLPYRDYALEYYYRGQAQTLYLETTVGDVDLLNWAMPRMQGAQRAVLVRWVSAHSDPRGALDWFLESNGKLVDRFWEADRWSSVYDLQATLALPELAADDIRFGALQLDAAYIPDGVPADDALPVAIEWTLLEPTTEDLKASVRVLDADNTVIVADDRVILSEKTGLGVSHWSSGTQARNYYLLDLPAGTPPVGYSVTVTVYTEAGALPAESKGVALGSLVPLGSVMLSPAVSLDGALPEDATLQSVGQPLADGLTVEAVSAPPATVEPGDRLGVTVYWRTDTSLASLEPTLQLVQAGTVVGESGGVPVYGGYPTDRWRPGELVADRRTLRVSPYAAPGEATLQLALEGRTVELVTVTITPSERSFGLPEPEQAADVTIGGLARLLGLDLPAKDTAQAATYPVTLYWEALADGAADYVVFAQLLAPDDRVIAQYDGRPADGRWPTSSWVQGQVITDQIELAFSDIVYQGPTRLIIGLYSPATLARLSTDSGADHAELSEITLP